MDNIDYQILSLLQDNPKITYKEIAEKIFLSASCVKNRILKMEKTIIKSYNINLDYTYLDFDLYTIIEIYFSNDENYNSLIKIFEKNNNVIECIKLLDKNIFIVKAIFKNEIYLNNLLLKIKDICEYKINVVQDFIIPLRSINF